MEDLDNLVSEIIADILRPNKLIIQLIESKLKAKGIVLTEEQRLQIKNNLRQPDFDGLKINLSEEQEKKLADSNDGHPIIDLGDEEELIDLETRLQKAISSATQETITLISDSILDEWKSQAPNQLKQQDEERIKYAQLIEQIWGKPLNLLEILLSVSLEEGSRFNKYYRSSAIKENDFVFEAITRLHARGCQIGSEILLLLRNGFADGAHARWRTLHEICVEARFIAQKGNNVAELFLLHSQVSNYQEAKLYQKYHQVLGYAPPNQAEIDAIQEKREELIKNYGKPFAGDYGWAAEILNVKRLTFVDLERSVGLDYLRPFYKLANANVHSGSKGAIFRLGSPPDHDVLVAGPSIYGLGEPGQNAAFSFFLLTETLLHTRENLDSVAFISATEKLMNEICWAFDEVMEAQEKNGS